MEYPEEIYQVFSDDMCGSGRRHAYEVGFQAGRAEKADPLAGYSNLTAAIKAGEPIDWEKLDGLKAKFIHPNIENLTITMSREKTFSENSFLGWHRLGMDRVLSVALMKAWHGEGGWTLWLEGEVPLQRKTADQLEVGTYFLGKAWGDSPCLAYVGHPLKSDSVNTIYYAPEMLKAITPASEWVVLEEYGPFQEPEGK